MGNELVMLTGRSIMRDTISKEVIAYGVANISIGFSMDILNRVVKNCINNPTIEMKYKSKEILFDLISNTISVQWMSFFENLPQSADLTITVEIRDRDSGKITKYLSINISNFQINDISYEICKGEILSDIFVTVKESNQSGDEEDE